MQNNTSSTNPFSLPPPAPAQAQYYGNQHQYTRVSDIFGIPPGYRFQPTDAELIVDYLMPRIINKLNPDYQLLFPIVNIYAQSPQQLVHGRERLDPSEEEWYFMTKRNRKYRNGSRPERRAGNGYWKLSGKAKDIDHDGIKVGARTVLDYHIGNHPMGTKTHWKMNEFVVEDKNNKAKVDDWIICRVYRFQRGSKNHNNDEAQNELNHNNSEAQNELQAQSADIHVVSQPNQSSIQQFQGTPFGLASLPYSQAESVDIPEVSNYFENVQTNQSSLQELEGTQVGVAPFADIEVSNYFENVDTDQLSTQELGLAPLPYTQAQSTDIEVSSFFENINTDDQLSIQEFGLAPLPDTSLELDDSYYFDFDRMFADQSIHYNGVTNQNPEEGSTVKMI